jgi:ATP-binding protein involved in chromosome partitioning
VGKSSVTVQLAAAAARAGRATAILDADFNGPTQARLTGIGRVQPLPGARGLVMPRNASGLGVVSVGSLVPETEALEFESVARGESHTWRATREFSTLAELLGSVEWGRLDLLLIDLPPGAERTRQFAEFLGPGVAFVLVTIPSDLARGVVARSLAALRATPNRVLGYVENMKGYCCAGCDRVQPLFPEGTALDLGIPCLGHLPFDPALAAAADRGDCRPDTLHPALRAALDACAGRIAAALEQTR